MMTSLFISNGPFWHLCTNGNETQIIFSSESEYDMGLNILATSACLVPDVIILTFVLMSNHIHLVLAGPMESCIKLFTIYKDKLSRSLREKLIDWRPFQAKLIPIKDDFHLKVEIAYVNRNPYTDIPNRTPSNYPWGAGREFFGYRERRPLRGYDDLQEREKRKLLHTRILSDSFRKLKFDTNLVDIPSFCRIDLAEQFFTGADDYTSLTYKKVESFTEIALELKDEVSLTDKEMDDNARYMAKKLFNVEKIVNLDSEERLKVALALKKKYNASKKQIKRILKLDLKTLEKIFPSNKVITT